MKISARMVYKRSQQEDSSISLQNKFTVFIKVMHRDGPEEHYKQKYILSAYIFETRVPVMRGIFDRFHGLSYLEKAEECGLRKSHGWTSRYLVIYITYF